MFLKPWKNQGKNIKQLRKQLICEWNPRRRLILIHGLWGKLTYFHFSKALHFFRALFFTQYQRHWYHIHVEHLRFFLNINIVKPGRSLVKQCHSCKIVYYSPFVLSVLVESSQWSSKNTSYRIMLYTLRLWIGDYGIIRNCV